MGVWSENSMVKIGTIITVKGKKYKIEKSTRKGKKRMAVPYNWKGETVHFGAIGHKIKTGTKHGDSYCARSSAIPKKKDTKNATPNILSRLAWGCKGKKSVDTNKK